MPFEDQLAEPGLGGAAGLVEGRVALRAVAPWLPLLEDGADEAARKPPAGSHIDGVGMVVPVSHAGMVPCPAAATKVRRHRAVFTFVSARM